MLYIWKIERTDDWGYDNYSAAIVVARTEDEARKIHPDGEGGPSPDTNAYDSWYVDLDTLKVTKLGTVTRGSGIKAGAVLLASYHAG